MNTNKLTQVAVITISVFIALILGFAVTIFPIAYLMIIPAIAFLVTLALVKPILLAPLYIAFVFYFPLLPVVDSVSIVLLIFFIIRYSINGSIQSAIGLVPKSYLVIFGLVLISTLVAIGFKNNQIPFLYREARIFMYLFFAIIMIAIDDSENKLDHLFFACNSVAFIVSVLAVIQVTTGNPIVATGTVADLDNLSSKSINTVRVQIPGYCFVMFAFIFNSVRVMCRPAYFWRYTPLLLLFGFAIIVNYGRAFWFWIAFALFVSSLFFKAKGFFLFIITTVVSISALSAIAMMVKPEMIETVTKRIESTFNEGGNGTSFGWREYEIKMGTEKLKSTAGLGVALGGEYRPISYELARWEDFSRYTHNSYLFIALKLSILGVLTYLALAYAMLKRAYAASKILSLRVYGIAVFAFVLSYFGLSTTQPEFMEHAGALTLAFCVAITTQLYKLTNDHLRNEDTTFKV